MGNPKHLELSINGDKKIMKEILSIEGLMV